MKKKGFTLIELLAVIVVLAVVALISIPVILNIIENAKKGALKDSALGLIESANMYYVRNLNSMPNSIEFEINDNKQVDENPKLDYKGKIRMGYVMLFKNGETSICVDDGNYVATKSVTDKKVLIQEGTCSGEWDDDTKAYAVSSLTGGMMKISVRSYSDKNGLPKSGNSNDIAIISDTKVTDYYLSNTVPENPREGMIWIVLSNSSNYYLKSDNIKLGVSYAMQYEKNSWNLKMDYVYNDKVWTLLCFVDFVNGEINTENSNLGDLQIEKEFSFTGDYQEFQAPFSGYYQVELWGAQGGTYGNVGGKGAYTKGDIYLEGGEIVYVYVGGSPVDNNSSFNGGGSGWASGGGATDIRLKTGTVETEFDSLKTRIMVAAGGGGGSRRSSAPIAYGGPGGALKADDVTVYGTAIGGSQLTGGAGAVRNYNGGNGAFGIGGTGNSGSSGYSAGGGGGYYGGGGGAVDNGSDDDGSGAGGSSYISGHKGCLSIDKDSISSNINYTGSKYHYSNKYFLNTEMKSGSEVMPSYDGTSTMTGNSGSGHAKFKILSIQSQSEKELANIKSPVFTEWEYYYAGKYQTFTAYKTGTYKVELWGSAGAVYGNAGGNGAYTSGEIKLEKGKTYYIYVGASNGFNGGGTGWGVGGGATDFRTVASSTRTAWNEIDSLKSRIMVAAGGGGGSKRSLAPIAYGGPGGGLVADSVTVYGTAKGGTQISGGAGAVRSYNGGPGSFAQGGTGNSGSSGYSAGGGGGWYGGGGGAVDDGSDDDGSGAGGSSYISGHAGCIAIDSTGKPVASTYSKIEDSISFTNMKFTATHMIDGAGYEWTTTKSSISSGMPTFNGIGTMNGNSGNGMAKITLISID